VEVRRRPRYFISGLRQRNKLGAS